MMKFLAASSLLLFSQHVYAQPSNDECVDATVIPPTINPFPYVDTIPNFSNATENLDDVQSSCSSSFFSNHTDFPHNATFEPSFIPDVKDVWYNWVPATTGLYDFSTIGSAATGFDYEYPIYPSFTIFEGNDCDALLEVSCGYSYQTGIELTAGKKYYVKITDTQYDDTATKLVFTITETPPPPPNDECIDAAVIPPSPEFPNSTVPILLNSATESLTDPTLSCTTSNHSFPPASDFPTSSPISIYPIEAETVWYTWTPSETDKYDFSTTGSKDVYGNDVFASVGIFTGATCDSLEEMDCSTYFPFRRVSLNAGEKYYIMVQTYTYNAGANLTLTVKPTPPPPPNDECINAITVDPFGGDVYTGDTSSAFPDTIPGTDGFCGTYISAPGTWYKFTNTLQTTVPIIATTCNNGTDFDTQISVFKGDSCGNLECVGGNDDGFGGIEIDCGLSSRFQFIASGQTTYYILVHGFSEGSVGSYALTVEGVTNYFGLIDSKTDTLIQVIDSFVDYGALTSTSSSLNIEAVFGNQSSIRSVRVTFDDPPVSFCENKAPFAVFTDNNGNFRDALIPVGTHEVTATAYGQQACKGPASTVISKTFDVTGCYYYALVHDGSDVYEIYGDTSLPSGCDINIELIPFCGFEVKEVAFTLRNADTNAVVHTRTEKLAPFFLFGNNGNTILDGTIAPGAYSLDMTIDGIKHSPLEFVVNATSSCN